MLTKEYVCGFCRGTGVAQTLEYVQFTNADGEDDERPEMVDIVCPMCVKAGWDPKVIAQRYDPNEVIDAQFTVIETVVAVEVKSE
jgi:hypothetical protein